MEASRDVARGVGHCPIWCLLLRVKVTERGRAYPFWR
jgi:hypothetical protein